MTTDEVTAVLKARDEASAVITRALHNVESGMAGIQKSASGMGGMIKNAASSMMGFVGANAVMGAASSAFAQAKDAIFGMNANLESSTLKFTTLMGSADKARTHVLSLFEFAKKTPFETGPIIEASKLLQTFGGNALNTKKNLTLIGDAAAATGRNIDELGFWTGRMYSAMQSGRPFGEAAMRLQELAVLTPEVRAQLEGMGNSAADGAKKWEIFQQSMERFGGAMALQEKSWSGVISTFADTIKMTSADIFRPLFEGVRDGIYRINQALGSEGFAEFAETARVFMAGVFKQAFATAEAAVSSLKRIFGLFAGEGRSLADTLYTVVVGSLKALEDAFRLIADIVVKVRDIFQSLPKPLRNIIDDVALLTLGVWALNTALGAVAGTTVFTTLSTGFAGVSSAFAYISAFGLGETLLLGWQMFSGAVMAFVAANPFVVIAATVASVSIALKELAGLSYWNQLIMVGESFTQGMGIAAARAHGRQIADDLMAAAKAADGLRTGLLPLATMRLPDVKSMMEVPQSFTDLLDTSKVPQFFGDTAVEAKKATEAIAATKAEMEAFQKIVDGMSGKEQIADVEKQIKAYYAAIKNGGSITVEAQEKLHKSVNDLIVAQEKMGHKAKSDWLHVRTATESMVDVYTRVEQAMIKMSSKSGAGLAAILSSGRTFVEGQGDLFGKLIVGMAKLPAGVRLITDEYGDLVDAGGRVIVNVNGVEKAFNAATGKFEAFAGGLNKGPGLLDGMAESLSQFPAMMVKALTGSGDWLKSISGLGAELGGKLGANIAGKIGTTLGKTLGSVFSTVLPAVGALVGPAVEWLGSKLFKTEGKKVNDMRDSFISAAGGLSTLAEKARLAGTSVDALLKAKTVKDFEAAVDSLNKKLEATAAIRKQIGDLEAILAGRSEMNWKTAEELIAKYGGTIETLGQQFVAAKQASSWKEVWDDWQTLIDMGADVGGVLVSMKDEIQALVSKSVSIGTEIPAQFKPLIEELIRTGQLFDDNGKAITDIGTLKFGAPLVSEVDKIVLAIKELVASLDKLLIPAFQNLGNVKIPPIKIPVEVGDYELPGGVEPPGFASGGIMNAGRGALAVLHGREAIVPLDKPSEIGAALAGAGGGRGGTAILNIDGRRFAEIFVPFLPGVVQDYALG